MSESKDGNGIWFIAFLLIFSGLALFVIWHYFHTYIAWLAIHITYYSIISIHFLYHFIEGIGAPAQSYNVVAPGGVYEQSRVIQVALHLLMPENIYEKSLVMRELLPEQKASEVTVNQLFEILAVGGYGLRLIFPLILCYVLRKVYMVGRPSRLRRRMDIRKLAKHVQPFYPHIGPAIAQDLLKQDPDKGPFRREDSPIRFAIKHSLITAYEKQINGKLTDHRYVPTFEESLDGKLCEFAGEEIPYKFIKDDLDNNIVVMHGAVELSEQRAKLTFTKQLGKRWSSVEDLPPLTKALYAAFIAQACGDKDTCHGLLRQFNQTFSPAGHKNNYAELSTKGVDEVIQKFADHDVVKKLHDNHGYVNTMLIGALYAARDKGKLVSPLFWWLKQVDRTLWYSLNGSGGQTGWTECGTPWAHYRAEEICKCKLNKPFTQTVLQAFREMLDNEEGWIAYQEVDENLGGVE